MKLPLISPPLIIISPSIDTLPVCFCPSPASLGLPLFLFSLTSVYDLYRLTPGQTQGFFFLISLSPINWFSSLIPPSQVFVQKAKKEKNLRNRRIGKVRRDGKSKRDNSGQENTWGEISKKSRQNSLKKEIVSGRARHKNYNRNTIPKQKHA